MSQLVHNKIHNFNYNNNTNVLYIQKNMYNSKNMNMNENCLLLKFVNNDVNICL